MDDINRQEIRNLIEVLPRQVEILLSYRAAVPLIEVDQVKENIRRLYELVNQFSTDGAGRGEAVKAAPADSGPVASQVDREEENLLKHAEEQFAQGAASAETSLLPAEEPVSPPATAPARQPEKPVASPRKQQKPTPEADLFSAAESADEAEEQQTKAQNNGREESGQPSKSIHDLAREKSSDKTLGENIAGSKIQSLVKAISINDKFQFINEFFNGKMSIYNENIARLDTLDSKQDALALVDELARQFGWDTESVVYEQFLSYIRRRY